MERFKAETADAAATNPNQMTLIRVMAIPHISPSLAGRHPDSISLPLAFGTISPTPLPITPTVRTDLDGGMVSAISGLVVNHERGAGLRRPKRGKGSKAGFNPIFLDKQGNMTNCQFLSVGPGRRSVVISSLREMKPRAQPLRG